MTSFRWIPVIVGSCAGMPPHAKAVRIWICDDGKSRVASRDLFGHSGSRALLASLSVSATLIEDSIKA